MDYNIYTFFIIKEFASRHISGLRCWFIVPLISSRSIYDKTKIRIAFRHMLVRKDKEAVHARAIELLHNRRYSSSIKILARAFRLGHAKSALILGIISVYVFEDRRQAMYWVAQLEQRGTDPFLLEFCKYLVAYQKPVRSFDWAKGFHQAEGALLLLYYCAIRIPEEIIEFQPAVFRDALELCLHLSEGTDFPIHPINSGLKKLAKLRFFA